MFCKAKKVKNVAKFDLLTYIKYMSIIKGLKAYYGNKDKYRL